MNYYDTLIEVADDCPATEAQVPQTRGGKKTKGVVEYELLVKHPYTYTEEDVAFEVYAVLHDRFPVSPGGEDLSPAVDRLGGARAAGRHG
jgi:Family of unknown function (DUF6157)